MVAACDFNGTKTVCYQCTRPDYVQLSDIQRKHAAYLTASPLSQCGLDQTLQGERYQATAEACADKSHSESHCGLKVTERQDTFTWSQVASLHSYSVVQGLFFFLRLRSLLQMDHLFAQLPNCATLQLPQQLSSNRKIDRDLVMIRLQCLQENGFSHLLGFSWPRVIL